VWVVRHTGRAIGYSAYVPELPTILVTGQSVEELTDRAAEAIRVYWENVDHAKALD
jgi:predicted RNase H-like HicB family nuclease